MISKCLSYDWKRRLKPHDAFLEPFFDDLDSPKYAEYIQKLPLLFDFSQNLANCPHHKKL
jgi:hypothetical protein